MDKKQIVPYKIGNTISNYVILIPIYYEYEAEPAWRKVFFGTEAECKQNFDAFPDFEYATYEDNKHARICRLEEIKFLASIGKQKKAEQLKIQYGF